MAGVEEALRALAVQMALLTERIDRIEARHTSPRDMPPPAEKSPAYVPLHSPVASPAPIASPVPMSDASLSSASDSDTETPSAAPAKRRATFSPCDSPDENFVQVKSRKSRKRAAVREQSPPEPQMRGRGGAASPLTPPQVATSLAQPPTTATSARKSPPTPSHTQIPSDKPSPVIVEAAKWTQVSKLLATSRVQFTRAQQCRDGVRIFPANVLNHRHITKILDQYKIQYHCFSLPEERTVRAVIRGIPSQVEAADVSAALVEANFAPIKVTRLFNRRTKAAFPLFLVELPRSSSKDIFQLNRLMSLIVTVEKPHPPRSTNQCHRCQLFHHSQRNCHRDPRCVKCGKSHATSECPKPRDAEAKCANCGGKHTASYRGCPAFPAPRKSAPAASAKITPAHAPPKTVRTAPAFVPAPPPQVNAWTKKSTVSSPASLDGNIGKLILDLTNAVTTATSGKDAAAKIMTLLPRLLELSK